MDLTHLVALPPLLVLIVLGAVGLASVLRARR
jgi:hypothetical protein